MDGSFAFVRPKAQHPGVVVRANIVIAVGYAIKNAGTTCFMTDATIDFIADFTAKARARGVEVLVEVHSHFEHQIAIGGAVDRVYDFALPPLVLHALGTGDGAPLVRWMEIRPVNAMTVLDTHDGIQSGPLPGELHLL